MTEEESWESVRDTFGNIFEASVESSHGESEKVAKIAGLAKHLSSIKADIPEEEIEGFIKNLECALDISFSEADQGSIETINKALDILSS